MPSPVFQPQKGLAGTQLESERRQALANVLSVSPRAWPAVTTHSDGQRSLLPLNELKKRPHNDQSIAAIRLAQNTPAPAQGVVGSHPELLARFEDPIVWRDELRKLVGRSSETIRLWMKNGTLPPPDSKPTTKLMGWKRSTLIARGFPL